MRIRLFLSFIVIILITTVSIVFLARWQAAIELRNFVSRGGFSGVENLVRTLEKYYENNRSWDGVENLFKGQGSDYPGGGGGFGGPGGRMGEQIRLADTNKNIILDNSQAGFQPGSSQTLTEEEEASAIAIRVNRIIVGYLILESRPSMMPNMAPNIESSILSLINRGAILAAVVSGLIAIILAVILGYVILRPVRELTHATEALGKGDLTQRVTITGDDELASLAQTFNLMAESLEQAEARRKAMTADIAHELRTPLAVQRANLEALQDGVYALDPENLTPIYEQTLLLERLVDDLRTLALADAGQLELIFTPTDLTGLVKRVGEQFIPPAEMAGRSLNVLLPPEETCPIVNADPGRIEQILTNLLSNALRHTPQNGTIILALECASNSVQITVRDTGPGIPPETLTHIFERFYRGERSRSRVEGGSGLGLSIARHLAKAHGGTLIASNHPEGGAVFTLSLPVT